jgi:hypothetical protein
MDNLKNLLELSTELNISVYNKRHKLRAQNTLIKEVEKIKKRELKKTFSLLSNLVKLSQKGGDIIESDETVTLLQDNIHKIDEFIKILPTVYEKNINDYIECYSNED